MAWEPDYVGEEEFDEYLRLDDDIDDSETSGAVAAASRAIDTHCRRQFGLVDEPQTRRYVAYSDGHGTLLRIDDLMSVTGLLVDGDAVVDPCLRPLNADVKNRPWTHLRVSATAGSLVAVTALWGWTDIPATVVEATKLQAHRVLMRRDSPYGVAGSAESGTEMRLLAKLDPDVAVMLRGFRRTARPL
jgi:hypothetical protein